MSRRAQLAAAIALCLCGLAPMSASAIPTITASPSTLTANGPQISIDLYLNVPTGELVTYVNLDIRSQGLTRFDGTSLFPVDTYATTGLVDSDGSGTLPPRARYFLGQDCGDASCGITSGAHRFASLLVTPGDVGDDLVLRAGGFTRQEFCQAPLGVPTTLVSITALPEPGTGTLIGLSLAGLAWLRRRAGGGSR
jgi:hypothetical protein